MKIRKDERIDNFVVLLFLMIISVLMNYLGDFFVSKFSLPLYLDSVGTILTAALGGVFPGILVGIITNFITGLANSNSLYFGIISIVIALVAGTASEKGFFQKFRRIWLLLPVFVILGVFGTILYWLIHGVGTLNTSSNTYAGWIFERSAISFLMAQIGGGMLGEIVDKGLSLVVVYILLKLLPDTLKKKFELGKLYLKGTEPLSLFSKKQKKYHFSLQKEVVALISVASISVGVICGIICFLLYKDAIYQNYLESAKGIAQLVSKNVPLDKIDEYVLTGQKDEEYEQTQQSIAKIINAFPEVKYLHVYQIQENGGFVVFDVDAEGMKADELGEGLSLERPHAEDMSALLQHENQDYVISHGKYGWLFTVYEPLYDSQDNCVAYVCVDMSMQSVVSERVSYITKMVSILLSALVMVCIIAIWYAERRIVQPINAMTELAAEYANRPDELKKQYGDDSFKLEIHTGNEIEGLYTALNKTMHDVTQYINDIQQQAEVIAKMQYNIITVFADMVENRDENTGEHIHRTAAFVGIIARQLQKEGKYTDILTEKYIEDLEISAPLHDIGKIKISDAILNKPGRLTSEEFEKMKTHTDEGRKILQKATDSLGEFSYLLISMDMSGYHHERWDGTGYPARLKGEDIPLCARIMAVADVFDALISKRSYKDAFSFSEAVDIIQEEKGTHFDPAVVDAFMHALDEVKAVAEENIQTK